MVVRIHDVLEGEGRMTGGRKWWGDGIKEYLVIIDYWPCGEVFQGIVFGFFCQQLVRPLFGPGLRPCGGGVGR